MLSSGRCELDTPGYGVRADECLGYIAQIVSSFEIVALQEVREDQTAPRRLLAILGPRWQFLVTDVSEGDVGHNERRAFLYGTKKVGHDGLAAEVVLPGSKRQFARTPYTCSFTACGTSLVARA